MPANWDQPDKERQHWICRDCPHPGVSHVRLQSKPIVLDTGRVLSPGQCVARDCTCTFFVPWKDPNNETSKT